MSTAPDASQEIDPLKILPDSFTVTPEAIVMVVK
jgi:hypothetical protein